MQDQLVQTHSNMFLAIALTLTLAGCNGATNGPSAADHQHATQDFGQFEGDYPIQVVATTGPVAEILAGIGGPHVEVSVLMGPGIDPHLYRAVPADVQLLEQADLIAYNGLHLEGRIADVFERLSRRKPVIAVTDGLVHAHDERLRKPAEFEGQYDPHVWHDPKIWSDCVRYVTTQLEKFDPDHSDDFIRNADGVLMDYRGVDTYCRQRIESVPSEHRVLVTAHDAFNYFSQAFGLETFALKGISTDDETSIGRMDDVVKMLVERKIPAVFVESAVAPRIVEALIEPCKAQGHEVTVGGELYADALGPTGSGAETYVGMLKSNANTIAAALGGAAENLPNSENPTAE